MSNMYGKDKFHDRQKAVLQKSAQKIENDSGWSQDNFLRGYAEEILPASGAELSFGELCAIGEQVEQEAAFSAKEAMRNKIKARRDAERYKSTGTDSEQRTPNPFEDSSAIATESPKNEDTLNTMRKHADAQPTKSAGIKTSKKQSLVETTRELKKYIHIISCGGVLYYHNEYYYTQLDSKQLIKLYRQNVDYGLTTNKTEGDHMTPEGTFPIYFAFSTKAKNTKIAFETISEDSVWVCDPESVYYNTLQSKNNPDKDWTDKGGAENMYPKFSKGSSNACICFGFNGDGWSPYGAVAYGGSALFIDGVGENGKMNSGYGDIKISGKDMTKLLSYLDSDYNPTITIRAAQ